MKRMLSNLYFAQIQLNKSKKKPGTGSSLFVKKRQVEAGWIFACVGQYVLCKPTGRMHCIAERPAGWYLFQGELFAGDQLLMQRVPILKTQNVPISLISGGDVGVKIPSKKQSPGSSFFQTFSLK